MKYILSFLIILFSTSSLAAPKSDLWSYWNQSDEKNTAKISHQSWQEILNQYLSVEGENTLFAYDKVTIADQDKLTNYLKQLASLDPRHYSKDEQYAYWVNFYNALTVNIIIENYPIESITKLGGFFSFGPWGENITTVAGKTLTLNDIEHRILRPIWQDPRTHYAVNCASLGCPNLQATVFRADNAEQLLELAATQYINSDKGVLRQGKNLQLSSIYDWFIEDFGSEEMLFQHLGSYRNDLADFKGKITYDYDWNLNKK